MLEWRTLSWEWRTWRFKTRPSSPGSAILFFILVPANKHLFTIVILLASILFFYFILFLNLSVGVHFIQSWRGNSPWLAHRWIPQTPGYVMERLFWFSSHDFHFWFFYFTTLLASFSSIELIHFHEYFNYLIYFLHSYFHQDHTTAVLVLTASSAVPSQRLTTELVYMPKSQFLVSTLRWCPASGSTRLAPA